MSVNKKWTVIVRCTVDKRLTLEGCTAQQAEFNPWDHAVGDEIEVQQIEWSVISVKEAE